MQKEKRSSRGLRTWSPTVLLTSPEQVNHGLGCSSASMNDHVWRKMSANRNVLSILRIFGMYLKHWHFVVLILLLRSYLSMAFRQFPLKNIVVFDGVCNFCNGWVDIILRFDSAKMVKFTAAQSTTGKELLSLVGRNPDELSSVVYIRRFDPRPEAAPSDRQVFLKSEAVLRVLEDVGVPSFAVNAMMMTIPAAFRDNIYDLVAKNRYNIMGKRESCRVIEADRAFK